MVRSILRVINFPSEACRLSYFAIVGNLVKTMFVSFVFKYAYICIIPVLNDVKLSAKMDQFVCMFLPYYVILREAYAINVCTLSIGFVKHLVWCRREKPWLYELSARWDSLRRLAHAIYREFFSCKNRGK